MRITLIVTIHIKLILYKSCLAEQPVLVKYLLWALYWTRWKSHSVSFRFCSIFIGFFDSEPIGMANYLKTQLTWYSHLYVWFLQYFYKFLQGFWKWVNYSLLIGAAKPCKGQLISKSRLASRRFSQKLNGRIWFVCSKE